MKAHILSTGDEILLGDITDTNTRFLCSKLKEMGIDVQRLSSVGDDQVQIADILTLASKEADLCFITGGLGPTKDDVTAQACAKAAGVELELDQTALETMKTYFSTKNYIWTQENTKQAMLPKGADVLENDCGTAPGFHLAIGKCQFFFMPGPPFEMNPMFENKVKPILIDQYGLQKEILIERITVFMLPESLLGALLDGFEISFPDFILGYRFSFPTIEVKIRFTGNLKDREQAVIKIQQAKSWVLGRLGDKVVSLTGQSIVQEVADLLQTHKKTVAVAESCTGGLISDFITNVPGSSDFFLFSAITYSNQAKEMVLGVNQATLIKYGAVHEKTALEMAIGVKDKCGADYSISTTGIAGPGGGTQVKPVGMVCIGLTGPGIEKAKTVVFKLDDREKNKRMFAMTALEWLRQELVKLG